MHDVSLVIPVFNERETLAHLFEKIEAAFTSAPTVCAWEIVFIDDGSTDGSWQEMAALSERHPEVIALRLRRNFGKSTALSAGVKVARFPVVITMDADLQDDPAEIPRFLEKLDEGYDLVSGWKKVRNDPISKRLPSKLFNWTARKITGVHLNDMNCGFKAYRREIFEMIEVYGDLHRYIPALALGHGFRIAEIVVQHHPRRFGVSKFGLERFTRGFLDLLTTVTITRYSQRPGHLFGGIGLVIGAIGFLILLYLTGLKVFFSASLGERPLLMLGIMLSIISVQFLLFGLLAELLVARTNGRSTDDLVVERIGASANPPAEKG